MHAPHRKAAHALARRSRGGYAMLIAVVMIALLTIIGSTTLTVAGTDEQIATAVRRHHLVMNAADAGTQQARWELRNENPADEGWDTADTGAAFVAEIESQEMFKGVTFPMNQGTYEVSARYAKCSNPPPGYSTELGVAQFRSDFWEMDSTAHFTNAGFDNVNEMEARVQATLRKVVRGPCKVR
jgi:hypothetical protein